MEYKIGDMLRDKRIEFGYTQRRLCRGICKEGTLSKIENNTLVPNRIVFEALMQRMGLSSDDYPSYVGHQEFETLQLRYNILLYFQNREYQKIEKLLEQFKTTADMSLTLNQQFVSYVSAILDKHKGVELQIILNRLFDAIHITIPDFDLQNLDQDKYLLTFDDINILNNIAILYRTFGKPIEAIEILYSLKTYMEHHLKDEEEKFKHHSIILYNLSKWLGLEQRYEEALEICDLALNICIELDKLFTFPYLLINKACDLVALGRKEEAKACVYEAYYIFEAMGSSEQMEQTKGYAKEALDISL